LFQRLPQILAHFQGQGKIVSAVKLQKEKRVYVFWATWCGPCTLELNRINQAIINKEIDSRHIYAVNMGEDPVLVKQEMQKRSYQFQSYDDVDNALVKELKVEVTPTVALVDEKHTLQWISSGISPTLIYRIQKFLEL